MQLPPGESEYTRMIKRPPGIGSEGPGVPGTPAGSGAPAAPGMGMPQMQMPGGMPMGTGTTDAGAAVQRVRSFVSGRTLTGTAGARRTAANAGT